jgi:hypothetical protein
LSLSKDIFDMRAVLILLILLAIGPAFPAAAQDSHYWDNQYGTKGELLGGLVVGSASDLSATFYNPGWIAIHGDPSILVTTKALEAYTIKLNDGLGSGIDPVSTVVTTSPGYLAGRFSSSDREGWQWAYSYLQKVKFEFDASAVRIETSPGPDPLTFSGEAFRTANTSEYWYGLTISRKLSENVGLGFSPYVAYRSMNSRTQLAAQGLEVANGFGQAYEVQDFSFGHARLLVKAGLAVELDNWSLGVAATTPSLGLFGSGKVLANRSYSGIDFDGDGTLDDPYLASDYQEKLSSSWKSPLSIAAGASVHTGSTTWHVTAEWFNRVPEHRILDPIPYRGQSTGESFSYNSSLRLKSVFNFGLAVDHRLRPRFTLYGSARSDFSALPDDTVGELLISNWDLWHFSVGAGFQFLDIEFTSGLQYSFGRGDNERFVNFNPAEGEDVLGDTTVHDIDYNRIKLLVGFNLPFGQSSP